MKRSFDRLRMTPTNFFQHALEEVAGGTFARFGTDLLVVEECRHQVILLGHGRTGHRDGNCMAARKVVEPAGEYPFIIEPAQLCRLRIKELHVKIKQVRPSGSSLCNASTNFTPSCEVHSAFRSVCGFTFRPSWFTPRFKCTASCGMRTSLSERNTFVSIFPSISYAKIPAYPRSRSNQLVYIGLP